METIIELSPSKSGHDFGNDGSRVEFREWLENGVAKTGAKARIEDTAINKEAEAQTMAMLAEKSLSTRTVGFVLLNMDAGAEPVALDMEVEPRSLTNNVAGEYSQEVITQGNVEDSRKWTADEGREIDIDALLAHLGDQEALLRVGRADDSIHETADALEVNIRHGTLENKALTDCEIIPNGNGVIGQFIVHDQYGGAVGYHGLGSGSAFAVTDNNTAQLFSAAGLEDEVPGVGLRSGA